MNDDSIARINRLFFEKLRARWPGHPWLATEEAKQALGRQDAMVWGEPRRVNVWWWMDVEFLDDAGNMIRYGRVKWNQDGTGHYTVSITYERENTGLYAWPAFRALSDAQEFVEKLMLLSLEHAREIHGKQWPGVVL